MCVDGAPTGELREAGAISLVMEAVPEPTDEERLQRYRATFERMNAVGLTGGHVMIGSPQLFEVCREMDARGWLTVRCVVPLHQEPDISDDEVAARLPLLGERGQMWRGGTAKFFIDGVVETGTAWLYEPDTNGGGTVPFWPPRSATPPSSRGSRAPASPAPPTPSATAPCGLRSMRTAPRARSRRHAPHRAHRDPPGPRPAAVRRRARLRVHAAAPHGEQLGRQDRSVEPHARAGAERPCVPDARHLGHGRARLPRLRLAGGAVRSAPRHGLVPAAARARASGTRLLRTGSGPDGTRDAARLHAQPGHAGRRGHPEWLHPRGLPGRPERVRGGPVDVDADDLLELPVTLCVVDGTVRHRAGF